MIKVYEKSPGIYFIGTDPNEEARLRSLAACIDADVRTVLEKLLNDAIGMASELLEAKHPDLAAAIASVKELNR